MSRFPRSSLFYFALVVVLGLVFWFTWQSLQSGQNASDWHFSTLMNSASDVKSLEINGSDGIAIDKSGKKHNVVLPDPTGNAPYITELRDKGVDVFFDKNNSGSYLLSVLLPNIILVILIAAFMWWVLRQTQSGNNQAMSFGRSRARLIAGDKPAITFADVAGVEEAKQELTEIVEFLKFPEKFTALGARIPKGVLMVGPPGTGKTLLARAVAGEAKVPFFSQSASEFVEAIVGVGASRVRDLFTKARQAAPAIIFIDELDAVGRSRSSGIRLGSNDEQEQTLNQILTEMDGFEPGKGVIVLAATNRADVLDQALLRPGRFDRRVTLQPPDRRGRAAILKIHTANEPLAPDVDLDAIAAATPGLVGADLRNLANEAALGAARKGKTAVSEEDFYAAIDRVLLGTERHLMLSPSDRERIAYHESGHALLGLLVPGADPVRKVTIIPHGGALGVTIQRPIDDRFNYGEDYLRARIVGALGGRAAEQLVYGVVSTGAANDLQQVTMIAHEMVVAWGMSPKIGPLAFREDGNGTGLGLTRPYSEATAREVDTEVKRIADECFAVAIRLLTEHRSQLEALTQALLKDDSLGEDQILSVTGLKQPAVSASSREG
ncbi:MAG: ATP-dependent zinc metalloprotease FtsH [Candidatus Dormibacteraceae bacterium]